MNDKCNDKIISLTKALGYPTGVISLHPQFLTITHALTFSNNPADLM